MLTAPTTLSGAALGLAQDSGRSLSMRKLVCTRAQKKSSPSGDADSSERQGKLAKKAGGLPSFLPFPPPKTSQQQQQQQQSGTVRLQRPKNLGTNKAQQPEGLFASLPIFGFSKQGVKDSQTVFVAGASGRLGIRVVHQLAAAGFKVRAGVRSEEKAQRLFDQLATLGETLGPLTKQDEARIKCVLFDLEDPETLVPALGGASRVVCAVGAADADFLDLSAPRRIDYEGTERLIEAAAARGVQQFVLITSLGTGKIGFPASTLNLFGGVLSWKRKAEEALERSGMPYLIVRPGGMERPKDNFKDTHNAVAAPRDRLFGGNVSRVQVAELITAALLSPELAENKTVELIADSKAPLIEYDVLLSQLPQEIAQETREEGLSMAAELRMELEEAQDSLVSARQNLSQVRESIAELQFSVKEKRASAKQIQKEQSSVIDEAARTEKEIQQLKSVAQSATRNSLVAKAIASEAQRAQREGVVLTRQELTTLKENVLRELTEASKPVSRQDSKQAKRKEQSFSEDNKDGAGAEDEASEDRQLSSVASFMAAFAPKAPVERATNEESQTDGQAQAQAQAEEKEQKRAGPAFFSGISNFFQPQGTIYVDEVAEQNQEEPVEESEPDVKPKKASRVSIRAERAAKNAAKQQLEPSALEQPLPNSTTPNKEEVTVPSFGGRFAEAFRAFSLPTIPVAPAASSKQSEKEEVAQAETETQENEQEEEPDAISQQQKDLENALNNMFSWMSPPQEKGSAAESAAAEEKESLSVPPPPPPPALTTLAAKLDESKVLSTPVVEEAREKEDVNSEVPQTVEANKPSNVVEAREWIASWRQRQGKN